MRAAMKTLVALGGLAPGFVLVLALVLALGLTLGACTALPKPFQRADAPPEDLHPAGDTAFEFQRTVSRLSEMQAADYIESAHLA